jgi:4'-phosphopantetheinyl transferase
MELDWMTADMTHLSRRSQPFPAGYFTLPAPAPRKPGSMPESTVPAVPMLPANLRVAWIAHRAPGPAESRARAWLAGELGCEPVAVPLVRDALGRPRLGAQHRRFDLNWSHSGDGLLIALGEHLQVGVDVERVRPRPRALALARRYFVPAEADWLATLPADERTTGFLRLWCAKEAVLKAHGRGLAFGLDRLLFVEHDGALELAGCDRLLGEPEQWSLREFVPAAGYRAAIAWRERPVRPA